MRRHRPVRRLQFHGRERLRPLGGQDGPSLDPLSHDRAPRLPPIPGDRADRERPAQAGSCSASGSSRINRASTRRTPSTKVNSSTPSSWPSMGTHADVSTSGSTEPSVGASASSGSSGAPYPGAQPSTKIRAMGRILAVAADGPRSDLRGRDVGRRRCSSPPRDRRRASFAVRRWGSSAGPRARRRPR